MGITKFDQKIDKANKIYKEKRAKYLKPLIVLLLKLKITPNFLCLIRAISGLIFFLLVNINFELAFLILIFGGLTDFIDGVLARHKNQDSDRGKFIDIVCDSIIFSFFILGLIKIGFANILSLSYFLFIIPLLYLTIIVNKNENIRHDWIIAPYARIGYYKIIFEIIFLLTLIFSLEKFYINSTLIILNIIMSIHFAYHFYLFLIKNKNASNS